LVFSRNVAGFTLGGPILKNKTFFFGGFQQDTRHSTGNFPSVVPTAAAVSRLQLLFPSNPRLDLYLGLLGDLHGTGTPIGLALGADPITGIDRGSVLFGRASLILPAVDEGPQWLVRLDHHGSEAHRMSWRYIYDSRLISPLDSVSFPGFVRERVAGNRNFLFSDSYTFGPSYTNEFRFSYGRLGAEPDRLSPLSIPLARTLPRITIDDVSAPGSSGLGQFRYANDFLFQETQTRLSGRHTFRYGVEFLKQLASQLPSASTIGEVAYRNATWYSALANFLDDFSGPSGRIRRQFGAVVFHPYQLRHSYFFQNTWKRAPSLSLALGLRYENFGQPANTMRYPAFSGFDPDEFLLPNRVNVDNNNFGPGFGFAWSPSYRSGWLRRLFGEGKTVWRGGLQISYDAFFTQMISLGLSTSTPNASSAERNAPPTGRGAPNWFAQLPLAGAPPSIRDPQDGMLEKDFRCPYTERWSFGFQRELPNQILLEGSYVGSVSHKLATRADLNPQLFPGLRLYPNFGLRWIRTSQGNSAYHAMQWHIDRRFARGFQLTSSYTWSRNLDSTSEGIGYVNTQYTNTNLTSVPIMQGGLKLDRGLSDFHRAHRLTFVYLWVVPGPSRGLWKHALGGWSVAGITSFQSGAPFTVINGLDRNGDGVPTNDRPDMGNPNPPRNGRAVVAPAFGPQSCPTGYRNPDTGACVNPRDVFWVEGRGLPNASTVGRNTLLTGGVNNFDLSLFKSFSIGERKRLEFRWEAFNAFNHPQFTQVPERRVLGSPGPEGGLPSRFLNRDFTDSGIRSMWVQVKVVF